MTYLAFLQILLSYVHMIILSINDTYSFVV